MNFYPGERAFELKATHGMPLDDTFERIIVKQGMMVEWPSFLDAARRNGWWDYQTYDAVECGLADAGVARPMQEHILQRFRAYILTHPHPLMT